ncbi:putative clathrin assembly protein [Iris pallida]|uniref:Clathrin assembly protein n=1 Tax=Iris pallida TaxID=29817 RepID=A0AAX6E9K6_IRIPA|nr:putative clathrin assembly protein [Iris pallida]
MPSAKQWWKRAAAAVKDKRSIYLAMLPLPRRAGHRSPDMEAAVIRATSHDERSVDYKNAARVFQWARTSPSFVPPAHVGPRAPRHPHPLLARGPQVAAPRPRPPAPRPLPLRAPPVRRLRVPRPLLRLLGLLRVRAGVLPVPRPPDRPPVGRRRVRAREDREAAGAPRPADADQALRGRHGDRPHPRGDGLRLDRGIRRVQQHLQRHRRVPRGRPGLGPVVELEEGRGGGGVEEEGAQGDRRLEEGGRPEQEALGLLRDVQGVGGPQRDGAPAGGGDPGGGHNGFGEDARRGRCSKYAKSGGGGEVSGRRRRRVGHRRDEGVGGV